MPLRILRLRSLIGLEHRPRPAGRGMYSTFFFGALYLEHVRGFGAVATGLAFLPMTLTVAVAVAGHERAPDGALRRPSRAARRAW